ncbi:hypothetical protein FGO68_gene820 [Halteria grandinella]|uniref:Uncharacterized protein n=1 Tax=Halteria grandinella TaxID=5974 RepID=A0A8J8SWZ2_HALGN|nr:hypothetical protein FGO68_gene820 [Halteria grandinella]
MTVSLSIYRSPILTLSQSSEIFPRLRYIWQFSRCREALRVSLMTQMVSLGSNESSWRWPQKIMGKVKVNGLGGMSGKVQSWKMELDSTIVAN